MQLPKEKVFALVSKVTKPARYVGGEWNSIVKPHSQLRVGICFPDLYEVGMSNSGIQILYSIINAIPDVACERVFAVDKDFEDVLRVTSTPLYTLETYTPLYELDMLGFNAACELLYTNILQVLDLGKIPLYAKDRNDTHPLVIIGGEAMSNPAPLLAYADAVFIGDGEEAIVELIGQLLEWKKLNLTRDELLRRISKIDGVLCNRDVSYVYDGNKLVHINAPKVYKRVSHAFYTFEPRRPVVPSIRSVQDRVAIQLDRGCKNLCKFCHAGWWELPYRKVDVGHIVEAIRAAVASTGYDDVSLHSLSVGDYSHIVDVLNVIVPELVTKGITISLPSLRVDMDTLDIIGSISDLKKTSITLAVESASESIRYRAYKRLHTDEVLHIIQILSHKGWQKVKLYFMIGLPGCEEVDEAYDIAMFLHRVHAIDKKMRVSVTISPFVPKPHTPFQYEKQYDETYCMHVIEAIKKKVPRSIDIKYHDVYASLIEGIFARGDTLLGEALLKAYKSGARLDLWSEHFSYSVWDSALSSTVGNWRRYLEKRCYDELTPWSIVKTKYDALIEKRVSKKWDGKTTPSGYIKQPLNKDAFTRAAKEFEKKYHVTALLRIKYAKCDEARFIGHIDCMEIIKRALRMAEVPVSFTRGFNKHPKIVVGPALPLGYESICEFVDVQLYAKCPQDILNDLGRFFPKGFTVISAYHHSPQTLPLSEIAYIQYKLTFSDEKILQCMYEHLMHKSHVFKKTKNELKKIPFSDCIHSFSVDNNGVLLLVPCNDSFVRPDTMIAQWCGCDHPFEYATITRWAAFYVQNDEVKEFK